MAWSADDDAQLNSLLGTGSAPAPAGSQPGAAPAQQAAATSVASWSDEDEASLKNILGKGVNKATGELRPKFADGTSPQAPINASPLDTEDRFKLKMGNLPGQLTYLKNKFEDATTDERGNLVVKDQGRWHLVDQKGFGDADPWEVTRGIIGTAMRATPALSPFADMVGGKVGKEIASDVSETAPMAALGAMQGARMGGLPGAASGAALGVAAGLAGDGASDAIGDWAKNNPGLAGTAAGVAGITALRGAATGLKTLKGAGLAAVDAGIVEGARTSLGRLVGTYEAEPEDQIKDIGLEMALNMGGVFLGAGVKPTAAMLAKAGRTMAQAPDAVKQINRSVLSKLSGAKLSSYETLDTNPEGVARVLANAERVVGRTRLKNGAASMQDHLAQDNVTHIKAIVDELPNAINGHWDHMTRKLSEQVGEDFLANTSGIANSIRKDAIESGLAKMTVLRKAPNGTLIRSTVPASEAAKILEEGAARPVKGMMIEVLDRDAIITANKLSGAPLNEVAASEAAHTQMKSVLENVEKLVAGTTDARGKQGLEQMLRLKKVLGASTFEAKTAADAAGLEIVKRKMAQYGTGMNAAVEGTLDAYDKRTGRTLGQMFRERNLAHTELKTSVAPIERAARQFNQSGDKSVFEGLLNDLTAAGGKKASKKAGFERVVQLVGEYGGAGKASELARLQELIRLNAAASDFSPIFGKGLATVAAVSGAGAGVVTPAIAATALPAAGTLIALSSPAAQQAVILPALRAANTSAKAIATPVKMAVDAGFKGLEFLKSVGPRGAQELLKDPSAMEQFGRAVLLAPSIHDATQNLLLQKAQGAVGNNGQQQ